MANASAAKKAVKVETPSAKVNGTEVRTAPVRVCFLKIWEPEKNEQGKEKYSLCMLIDKNEDGTIDAINAAIDTVVKAKFDGSRKGLKLPLRDGDDEKDTEKYPHYENMYFMNASSVRKPVAVNRRNEQLSASDLMNGDYAIVSLNFFDYTVIDAKTKKPTSRGVGCGLGNILYWEKGESLGGGAKSTDDDFGDLLGDSGEFMD